MENRDIKFRAWDGEKMHRVGMLHWSFRNGITIVQAESRSWNSGDPWMPIEKPILMQFTGITDVNGVEICEGDILAGGFVVQFKNGCFRPWSKDGKMMINSKGMKLVMVIGNIHENPELIDV